MVFLPFLSTTESFPAISSVIPGSPGPPSQPMQHIISTPSPRPSILRKRGDATGVQAAAKRRLPFMKETSSSPNSSSQPAPPAMPCVSTAPVPQLPQPWVLLSVEQKYVWFWFSDYSSSHLWFLLGFIVGASPVMGREGSAKYSHLNT